MRSIYLHGFASSPRSHKARDLEQRFARLGQSLLIPDLNQADFSHLTLTRQMRQVEQLLPPQPTPVTLIGSSLGGLTAVWLAEQQPQVQCLVLLAPAFGFLSHWLPKLGESQVQQWQSTGYLSVYHYGEERTLPLHYGFVEDASQYLAQTWQRQVPTLVLHGRHDEVIPLSASLDFASARPWVRLVELESDHSLSNQLDDLWQAIRDFCGLAEKP
jgi:pimeloyl-ACP methyl ester carboxylesterase